MEAIQKEIRGKREDMGSQKAVREKDGTYSGGIEFERSRMAQCLRTGERCYPIGNTIQTQRKMSAPGAPIKVFDLAKKPDAELRLKMMKVSGILGICILCLT